MVLAETILSLDQAFKLRDFGMDQFTFYLDSRVMRQMCHVQGMPPARAIFEATLILSRVTIVVQGSWYRGAHVVEPGISRGRSEAFEAWWVSEHEDHERGRKATLTQEIEGRRKATLELVHDHII
ncbi:hypothetical protein JCGZ_00509 [Jatropha curcas]|uniref:Aminotransferase-like plant mobile domain-containing protein n=1 Tax=Jatropha curcas TaxID=180498 RepID=A0A067JU27_JATCU|nr:hypothetical protein JCGZ_00509 [Jatropha curcas]